MEDLTIYTIGYTGFKREELLAELKKRGINSLIDVRSFPYSERYPDFNSAELSEYMQKNGVIYKSYAKEFGARPEDPRFYTFDGYLDFAKFAASETFSGGVNEENILEYLSYDKIIACGGSWMMSGAPEEIKAKTAAVKKVHSI